MTKESRKEKERRRHIYEILESAASLVAKKGITNISMDDIASEADFGKGTLYNYFKSKDDLIWCLINRTLDSFPASVTESIRDLNTCKDRIRRVVEISMHTLEKDPTIFELWEYIEINLGDPRESEIGKQRFFNIINFLQSFAGIFKQGIESGEIKSNNPMMLTVILFSMLRSVYKSGKSGINDSSPDENVEFITNLLFEKL